MPHAFRTDSQAVLILAGAALVTLGLALPSSAVQTGSTTQTPPATPTIPLTAAQLAQLRSLPVMGNADSNGAMIAVTGIDQTGSSILYLVDTQNRQIAIYQATGGSASTQGLRLVGARRIDLDLQLEGYNDHSEYPYEELEKRFDRLRAPPSAPDKR